MSIRAKRHIPEGLRLVRHQAKVSRASGMPERLRDTVGGSSPVAFARARGSATRYFPGAWYLETQPTITLDFENGTSSVPVALTVGKVVSGHWNFSLEAVGYPPWTAPPSKTYELRLTIGYHFPAL